MAEEKQKKNGDGEPSGTTPGDKNDDAHHYQGPPILSAAGETSDLELEYMEVEETLNQTKSARKVTSDEIHWKRVSGEKVSDDLQQRWQEISSELEGLEARKEEILRLLDESLAGEREKRKSLAGIAVFAGRGRRSILLPAAFTLSLLALAVWSSFYFLGGSSLPPGSDPKVPRSAIPEKTPPAETIPSLQAVVKSETPAEDHVASFTPSGEKPTPPPPSPPAPEPAVTTEAKLSVKTPPKSASKASSPSRVPSAEKKALPAKPVGQKVAAVEKAAPKPALAVREPGKPERRDFVPAPAVSARSVAKRRKEVLSKKPSAESMGKENPLFRQADSYRLQSNYTKAEETYIKIIENMPGEGRVFVELGDLYLEMGHYSRAKKMYDRAAIIFQARR